MEYLFSSFSVLFTFLLSILMITSVRKRAKTTNVSSTQNLPPGPLRLPLIGNLHNLVGSPPHHRLRDLAEQYGPLMRIQLGEVSHILVSSPDVAKEMLKTHDVNFAQRPFVQNISKFYGIDIIFAHYGDYWRQMRKICSEELLSHKRVQSFQSIREEEVFDFVRFLHLKEGGPINFSEEIFSLTYNITGRAVFGKKCKEQKAFISAVDEGLRLAAVFSVTEAFPSQTWLRWISRVGPKFEKKLETIDITLDNIINEYKADGELAKNDTGKAKFLLDILFDLQGNSDLAVPLETRNIKAIIMDMFIAGGNTSSTVIEWTMLEMLKNPRVMEKAKAEVRRVFGRKGNVDELDLHELKFLKMVIKESMRLHPPGPLLFPRESKESCVMNGYYLPAKTNVVVNVWAIGRDPRYWTEAENFYPERFIDSSVDFKGTNFEFIPFGAGRRMCPGISFAMADIELTLAQLLFHFDWKLPNGINHENLDMTESFGMTVRRKGDLYLIPVPYINPLSIE